MSPNPDPFQRISELFEAVRAIPAEKRRAFLEEACAGDETMRSEIESLLAHHDVASEFLNNSPLPNQLGLSEAELPFDLGGATSKGSETGKGSFETELPSHIGPYRILSRLGEGGMGVVYFAEQQTPVHRRVALKRIKLGMDTEEVIRRFESERQALAMMEHSSIAKVYDVGTHDERPYFAMEYVDGVQITSFCTARGSTTRERLELFAQVCDAIQHAHQKGIIHRDIKPSNVLVTEEDDRPLPKVIDFGVAKATARRLNATTFATQAGVLIGTPAYMSPEQADPGSEDIDTRSDVYSLGMLLYELLVGALPLNFEELYRKGLTELQRAIRETEAIKPSTRLGSVGQASPRVKGESDSVLSSLVRELRGDLDWITLKALEKDRSRRYSSVSELSADVRRYLEDQPVLASPPHVGYRLKKFVRRNRGRVSLAIAAMVIVLLAATASRFAIQAMQSSRTLLEASYEPKILAAVREMQLGQFSIRKAGGRVGFLHPFHMEAQALLRDPGLSSAVTAIRKLDAAIALLPERVDGYWYRARAWQILGDEEKARDDLRRTLQLDPDFLPGVIALADLVEDAGEHGLAAPWRERIEKIRDDDDDGDGDEGWARHWLRARKALLERRWGQAAEAYTRAIELGRANEPYAGWTQQTRLERTIALIDNDERILALSEVVIVKDNWPASIEAGLLHGRVLLMFEDEGQELAERVFEELYDSAEHKTVVALGVASFYVTDIKRAFDWIKRISDESLRLRCKSMGLFILGPEHRDEAMAAGEKSVRLAPQNAANHSSLARSLLNFNAEKGEKTPGDKLPIAIDRPEKTVEHLEKAIEHLQKAVQIEPDDGRTHAWLAWAYARNDEKDRALKSVKRALELGSSGQHGFHGLLASAYDRLGDEESAREFHKRAVELQPMNPGSHFNRGRFLSKHGDHELAIECFDDAINLDDSSSRPHTGKGMALTSLAREERDPDLRSRLEERAIASFRKATLRVPHGPHPHVGIARLLREQGDWRGAFRECAKALEVDMSFPDAHQGLRKIVLEHREESRPETEALRKRLQKAVDAGETNVDVLETLELISR